MFGKNPGRLAIRDNAAPIAGHPGSTRDIDAGSVDMDCAGLTRSSAVVSDRMSRNSSSLTSFGPVELGRAGWREVAVSLSG